MIETISPKLDVMVQRRQDPQPWQGTVIGKVVRQKYIMNEQGYVVKVEKVMPEVETGDYLVRDERNFEFFARADQMKKVAQ